jgi:hypothetical protein
MSQLAAVEVVVVVFNAPCTWLIFDSAVTPRLGCTCSTFVLELSAYIHFCWFTV